MPRSSASTRRLAVAALLALVLISAFVPSRFAGYADSLGRAVETALLPISHPMTFLSSRARQVMAGRRPPMPDDLQAVVNQLPAEHQAAAQAIAHLSRSLEEQNQINFALTRQVMRLREENQALRNLRAQLGDEAAGRLRLPVASIAGRGSDPAAGTCTLNQGARDGLAIGQPAVKGANLVGRIVSVGPVTSTMELVTRPELRLEAIITPPRMPGGVLPEDRRTVVQFVARPTGRLVASDVRSETPAAVGDYVRLVDHDWPEAVQGMIIGRVERVEPLRDSPLLKRVIIEPRLNLRTLTAVTVIVRQTKPAGESDRP
jgi:cell shape-determining protein MreC